MFGVIAARTSKLGLRGDQVAPGQVWTAELGNRKGYKLDDVEAALDRRQIAR